MLRSWLLQNAAPAGSEPSQGFVFFYLITKDRMISAANIVAANIAIRFRSEYT